MFHYIDFFTSRIAIAALLVAFLWHRYTVRRDNFVNQTRKGTPATFPYVFPFLGSLPVLYLWKPRDFVLDQSNFFHALSPVRVKILTKEFYTVRGPEQVKALFKASAACTSIPFVKFALGNAFGLSSKALRLFDKDDSGGGHVPYPGSAVEARNRIDYLSHQSMMQLLEGKGLTPLCDRFSDRIMERLYAVYVRLPSNEWEEREDLMGTVGDETTRAILNALCGPHLLGLNSRFLRDFWDFDRNLQTYMQGIPWFLASGAYAARKRVLSAVRVWHQHARENFRESPIDSADYDPFWGSTVFRDRQNMFLGMDGFDHAAIASLDFGAIWASRNSIVSTSWAVYEVFRDPELLAIVRAEVDARATKADDGRICFNIDDLLRLPVLQAVYAETLRLRMHFYIIRMPDRVDITVQGWTLPRRTVIVTPTTVAHMDSGVWSTGQHGEHPVDQFWAGRFLKYPHDDDCGPIPEFSTKGLEGSWIPYGGGPRQCPGRHFAKRQILLTIALMVNLFDCEILDEGRGVREDFTLWGFGSGVSNPVGKVPMRIRRRVGNTSKVRDKI